MKFFKKTEHGTQKYFPFLFDSRTPHLAITPYRDWFLLIIIGVILGIALIFVSAYLFFIFNDNEESMAGTLQNSQLESVNEAGLKSALALFEEKKNILEKLLVSPPTIVDPSL